MPVPVPPAATAFPVALVAVGIVAVAGALAGAATHRWLAWLRRGARVSLPSCVVGVGTLWAGVAAFRAAGVLTGPAVPLLLGLCWLVVAGSLVDLAVHRLPDALTIPAGPAVMVLLVPLGWSAVVRGVLAAGVLCVAHGLVRLVGPHAMGGGDVKLAPAVGAALGGVSWSAVVLGTVLAAVLTAAAAAVRVPGTVGRSGGHAGAAGRSLPHGPSMLLACLTVVATAAAWPGAGGAG